MTISPGMKAVMKMALFFGAVALVGTCVLNCTLPTPPSDKEVMQGTDTIGILRTPSGWSNIIIVRDAPRQTTCYVTTNSGGGISCIPDQFNKLP